MRGDVVRIQVDGSLEVMLRFVLFACVKQDLRVKRMSQAIRIFKGDRPGTELQ